MTCLRLDWRTYKSAVLDRWAAVTFDGERNLRRILAEYTRHYNGHRPHQALRQEPPQRQLSQAVDITARIERRQVLGGLINEYRGAA
jgi:putative transposase